MLISFVPNHLAGAMAGHIPTMYDWPAEAQQDLDAREEGVRAT